MSEVSLSDIRRIDSGWHRLYLMAVVLILGILLGSAVGIAHAQPGDSRTINVDTIAQQ